jgi:hypothetical protein
MLQEHYKIPFIVNIEFSDWLFGLYMFGTNLICYQCPKAGYET